MIMAEMANEFLKIEEELVELFKQLLAQLPAEVATLSVKHLPNGDGVLVALNPRNPLAAEVWAHATNAFGRVDFGFGKYSPTWELPIEGENPESNKNDLLKEVRQKCKAVISGDCEHKRRFLGVTARIRVGGRDSSVTDLLVIRTQPPLRGVRKYEAYLPAQNTAC
jgi:hypothetical protein